MDLSVHVVNCVPPSKLTTYLPGLLSIIQRHILTAESMGNGGFQMIYAGGPTTSSSELEGFLLSDVGIQPNGMPLTVLSLLARMGVDPWSEAEHLSTLSNESAVSWMAIAINRSPPYSWEQSDVTALASHLVDRLPARSRGPQFDTSTSSGLEAIPVWVLMVVIYVIISAFLMLFLATA